MRMNRKARDLTWAFALCALSFLYILHSADSAVFSVDLGSEWIKVAVVDIKLGQSPISIALNEMSKRKSPALVAFSNGDRLLSEEASGITARYPERVYVRVRDMVGKPFETVKELVDSSYLPYELEKDESGIASIRTDDLQVFRTDELLAMILNYARDLAEVHTRSVVKDAVISVPPYFGQIERKALLNAAGIAGINVLTLINEHSAAALQYGIDKDFSNESRNVLFYDMGANSAYAAIIYFSSYTVKERGKNVTFNYFQVKGVRWEAEVGGQAMEMRLVEHFADEFNKIVGSGFDVRKFPKAMAKLKKQVKKTKEVLSANTDASIFVDSLHNDLDFKSTITRKRFEELCTDIWQRAIAPIESVLKDVGLSSADLFAVELLGGATRVPKLQATLLDFLSKKSLERHLDADEAIALGAALHAANISDGIKLNKKLGMIDGISYGMSMKIEASPEEEVDDPVNNQEQVLFPRLRKVPGKITRAVNNKKDFKVALLYESDGLLPPGTVSRNVGTFMVNGVANAYAKYEGQNISAPIKTNLHISLSRSGVVSLDRAETVIEITDWVDVPVIKNNSATNNSSSDNAVKELESQGLEGKDKEVNVSSSEAKPEVIKKLRKRVVRVPLTIEDVTPGVGKPVTNDTFIKLKNRLEKLREIDAAKRETAEAKNNLESYVYATKDILEVMSELPKVSTAKQLEFYRSELAKAEDWLYSDGEDASGSEFRKRLGDLKRIGDPIFFRHEERYSRPAAAASAKKYLQEVADTIKGWESSKPWLLSEGLSGSVQKEMNALQSWLEEKEAEQKKLQGHMDPAYTSKEVLGKVEDLKNLVVMIGQLPKPKPKVEKPAANTSTTEGNSGSQEQSTGEEVKDGSQPTSTEDSATSENEQLENEENHDEL